MGRAFSPVPLVAQSLASPQSMVGQVALVTGATSGIGQAVARHLARLGVNISAVGRNESALTELTSELRARQVDCQIVSADLSDPGVPASVVEQTIDRLGALHVLVMQLVLPNTMTPFACRVHNGTGYSTSI